MVGKRAAVASGKETPRGLESGQRVGPVQIEFEPLGIGLRTESLITLPMPH